MTEDGDHAEAAREAFALLGHEIRLDILLALLSEWRAARTEPRSYSELMRAVGMEDSGKFNYHLQKLRGAYVRKVEDGYVPTASATALYRAVLATRPIAEPASLDFDVDASCPDCDGPLGATYEQDFLTVACRDCGSLAGHFTYPFPSNGLADRTDEELLAAVARRAEHHVALARSGQCPFCAGTTEVSLRREHLGDEDSHDVEITCGTCTFVVGVSLLFALDRAPKVTTALVALGIPVETYEKWTRPTPAVEVRSGDSTETVLELEKAGRTATVVIDETLEVLSVAVDGEPVSPP
jgi:DNA-binding transcriptional ArsR family regulator